MGGSQAANAAFHGVLRWGEVPLKVAMYWAGDSSGVMAVGVPLLLLSARVPGLWAAPPAGPEVFAVPFRRPLLAMTVPAWRRAAGITAATVAAAWIAFGLPPNASLDYTYVLVLPVAWAAARHGFAYASAVVLVMNVSVVLVFALSTDRQVADVNGLALQFGLVTISAFGVVLGAFISDRRQQRHRLAWALQRAEVADRLKATLLTNMSHEVRTPLTALIGYADVIEEEATGEVQAHAARIREGGQRLLETLTLILEQAHLEAGLARLRLRSTDVAAVARGVAERFRAAAQHKGLTLEVRAASAAPAMLDPDGLDLALGHVVSNAVKFTERGTVTVECEAAPDEVVVRVRDTGVGMPARVLPLVFEPFWQATEGRERAFEGVGLGLSIVKQYVEGMGGNVAAESAPGRGSCFTLRFPRR